MFENVTFFEQLHSKFAKNAKVTSKIISFNKSNYGYQKSLNVMMIRIRWNGLGKMFSNKLIGKKRYWPPTAVQRLVLLSGWAIWKYWNCPWKFFSLGSWLVSALSTPNRREGYNFFYWLTRPKYNFTSTALMHPSCEPTFSRQTHKQTSSEILDVNLLLINLHTVPIYEIKIKTSGVGHLIFLRNDRSLSFYDFHFFTVFFALKLFRNFF